VRLRLELASGDEIAAAAARDEIYVAVGDAFRAARRQLLARADAGAGRAAWLA
jgi:hypothetical protein